MKCSVCGGVHRPRGTCAGQGGGGTGGIERLVQRGQWEPRHDPGPLAVSLPGGAGCSGISILAVQE